MKVAVFSGSTVDNRRSTAFEPTASLAATIWKPAVLALFAGWLLFVGHHHEPWFDEAQAWLLARDSTPAQLLVERVRYEGTPALWHLLLWCVIRLGLPFGDLYLVSTLCAVIGAAIILWRSPFPPLLRVGIVCSYFFSYQFSIIARSYSLDLVLVPLLAWLFSRRVERPVRYAIVVGLIANANTHGVLMAGCFGLEWLVALVAARRAIEWHCLAAIAIAGAFGLLAIATAWQPADNAFLTTFPPPRAGAEIVVFYIREAFVDRLDCFGTVPPSLAGMKLGFVLSVAALGPSVLLFRRAGHGLLAVGLVTTLTAFSVWKYAYGWHAGLLFLVWLTCLWASWPALSDDTPLRRLVVGSMALVLTSQMVEGLRTGVDEVGHVFSAGPEVAEFAADWRLGHPRGRIAAFGFNVFAAEPWFATNIFANYHQGKPDLSYIRWNASEPWKATVGDDDWHSVLASDPGLILVSLAGLPSARRIAIARSACRSGFGPLRVYPASSIWKGYIIADDTLGVVARRERATTRSDCSLVVPVIVRPNTMA